MLGFVLTVALFSAGAAGNFISPISGLSANAFKTVLDIDTIGSVSLIAPIICLVPTDITPSLSVLKHIPKAVLFPRILLHCF
jgi:type III secretory pathway component EscT